MKDVSTNPPADPSAVTNLSKLTVAQLKALCKEKKLTGYSKLGKAALLQKLTGLSNSNNLSTLKTGGTAASTPVPANAVQDRSEPEILNKCSDQHNLPAKVSSNTGLPSSSSPVDIPRTPAHVEQSGQPTESVSRTSDTNATPSRILSHANSEISPLGSVALTSSILKPKKRPADVHEDAPISKKKKPKTATVVPVNSASKNTKTLSTTAVGLTRIGTGLMPPNPPNNLAALSVPTTLLTSGSTFATSASSTASNPVVAKPPAPKVQISAKRFKPLVISKRPAEIPNSAPPAMSERIAVTKSGFKELNATHLKGSTILQYLDYSQPSSPPTLVPITLPPSLSQRRRVLSWAVILSELTDQERTHCVLVSRMLRYAVYLSASQRLSRYFDGKRIIEDITSRYTQSMTNMWPYLRWRETEVAERRELYDTSFVAGFYKGHSLQCPVASHLWGSPDNERQIAIAVRFAMTRLWFAISLGGSSEGRRGDSWLEETIVDAQEIIKDEIWSITLSSGTCDGARPRLTTVHVLARTCEVVGRASQSKEGIQEISAVPMRADWSSYIAAHLGSSGGSSEFLVDRLKWGNHEEYIRGIAKLWLERITKEGPLGDAKRVVAERYVLACVVSNSVSGQWLSASAMAQDFAGLTSRMNAGGTKAKPPAVNLYLPEHHYVESVHFTASSGKWLHPAVAVVQTPHREYFILRDNGMQIGCEEDGIAPVWRELLKCDSMGISI